MRPLLGDLLAAGSGHIDAVTNDDPRVPSEAAHAVVRELANLTAVMARCADAFVLDDHTNPVFLLDTQTLALLDARSALRHAAARMHTAAGALGSGGNDTHHPVAAHLSAATAYLSAGHDLMQSHFAPEPSGSRRGNSLWAPAIVSTPVNAALVTEIGAHAGRLAPWMLQLAAAPSDKTLPTPTRVAISVACRWLRTAEAATWTISRGPTVATERALLHAIPANVPPPRRSPRGDELMPELCTGAIATAERLRHLAHVSATRAGSPRMGLAGAWQRTAQGAAITGHCSELILHQLIESAAQFLSSQTATAALQQAVHEISGAWAAWRAVSHEWDTFTTRQGATLTPVAAEIGDLTMWVGRLAYTNPSWTPARNEASPVRTGTALTNDAETTINVVAALHQVGDALAHIAADDRENVRSTAADGDLYVPRRLLPDDFDLPYRYVPAPPAMTDALLTMYDGAIQAAIRAVTALDNLAVALSLQSTTFARLHAFAPLNAPCVSRAPTLPSCGPTGQSLPGRVEQALRRRGIIDPALLARAADIDDATRDLIKATTGPTERRATANRAALHALKSAPTHGQHPARTATKDSPPTTASNTPLLRLAPINHQIRHGNAGHRRPRL